MGGCKSTHFICISIQENMRVQLDKIYNEDCLIGMSKLPCGSVDVVLTSPPYNMGRNTGNIKSHEIRYDSYKEIRNVKKYCDWTVSIFNEFNRVLKQNGCILYNLSYGNENPSQLWLTVSEIITKTDFTVADTIVWKKRSALPNNVSHNKLTRICEFVFVFCRKSEYNTFTTNKCVVSTRKTGQNNYENIFNFIEARNNDGSQLLNKATFSTELVSSLLKIYGKKFGVVLDCFMGTGTTALGAILNSMHFIGYELSKKQCEYANERIKNKLRVRTLFGTIDYTKEYFV